MKVEGRKFKRKLKFQRLTTTAKYYRAESKNKTRREATGFSISMSLVTCQRAKSGGIWELFSSWFWLRSPLISVPFMALF